MSLIAQSHSAVFNSDSIHGSVQILQEDTPCILTSDTFAVKEGSFVVKVAINYDDEEGASEDQHLCTDLYVDGVCIRGYIIKASPVATHTFTCDRHRVNVGGGQNEMRQLTFAKPQVSAGTSQPSQPDNENSQLGTIGVLVSLGTKTPSQTIGRSPIQAKATK